MRLNKKRIICSFTTALLLIFSCIHGPLLSQEKPDNHSNIYHHLNKIVYEHYGSDDLLINGILYQPLHSKAEGNPYYPVPAFNDGLVFISGREFGPEKIKYNAELQQLILKRKISKEAVTEILLNNSLIDSFSIRERLFINTRFLANEDSLNGFMEIMHRNGFSLYAFIRKIFKDDYTRSTPFGRYQQLRPVYFFMQAGEGKIITSRKEFLRIFGNNQREIKRYMRQQNIKFKKASSRELSKIITYSERVYGK